MRASKKVKGAVLLTAGAALILGAPTVYADDNNGASNSGGLLNNVQALNNLSLNLPINPCGVGALLGEGDASCKAGAGNGNVVSTGRHGGGGGSSDDNTNTARNSRGLLNNLQVGNNLTANVPVNACGIGALLADGNGKCSAYAGNNNTIGARTHGRGGGGSNTNRAVNRGGLLNNAQVLNNASLNIPIDLCGVGLLLAEGDGNCKSFAGNGNVIGGGKWYRGSDGHEWRDSRDRDGREWREDRGGRREVWDGHGWSSDNNNRNSAVNRGGLLNNLQLLNNVSANVPVTVCGLAVLGSADCRVNVEAGNHNRIDTRGGERWRHVEGEHRHWENEVLPETGAAGLALLPFGLALVAGGVALRRRIASQR